MMAFDSRSTPPDRRTPSDATLARLRDAVLQLWHAADPTRPPDGAPNSAPHGAPNGAHLATPDDAALASALAGLVREARERELRAEEMLLAFKALLAGLRELQAPERRLEATRFQEQLVTRCIKAYYDGRA